MKFISNSNDVSEFLGIKIIKIIPLKDFSIDTQPLKKK